MVEKNTLHKPKPKITVPSQLDKNLTQKQTLNKIEQNLRSKENLDE